MPEFEKDKRLTPTEMDYLLGNHEPPSNQAERVMRHRIREKGKNALGELSLLAYGLSQEDIRDLLFDSLPDFELEAWEKAREEGDSEQHLKTLSSVMMFAYLGTEHHTAPLLEEFTKQGIRSAFRRKGKVLNSVDVSIKIDSGVSVDEIDTSDLSSLSGSELQAAIQSGKFTGEDELKEAFDELNSRKDRWKADGPSDK